MNQQSQRFAQAATASAAQAQEASNDLAVKKLAEAVGYLGLAAAETDKENMTERAKEQASAN